MIKITEQYRIGTILFLGPSLEEDKEDRCRVSLNRGGSSRDLDFILEHSKARRLQVNGVVKLTLEFAEN